jgi:hypothetical protein
MVSTVFNAVEFTCWWQHILHEHEDGLLGADLDPLTDHIDELPHCQVRWHQVPVKQITDNECRSFQDICHYPHDTRTPEEIAGSALLLVDIRDVALLGLLDDHLQLELRSSVELYSALCSFRGSDDLRHQVMSHRDPVWILVPDASGFSLPLLLHHIR